LISVVAEQLDKLTLKVYTEPDFYTTVRETKYTKHSTQRWDRAVHSCKNIRKRGKTGE